MKQIVITGVSRGLGAALTAGLIERGHRVAGCARSAEAVQALQTRWGDEHSFATVDVADDRQVADWAADVHDRTGPPEVLINNAAITVENAPLWEISAEDFDRLMAVNVSGTANVIRHFVPAMVQRRQGVIVNLSSGWGRSVSAEVAPYCGSKWAIEGLTRALAEELPSGMAAVSLNPGIIDTDMLRTTFGAAAAHHIDPQRWTEKAIPYILKIGPADNGRPLSVPA
jgi:NAD(P)-dependent dehydrogenase (short-subunit alcohol dehydrogenase family)